MDERLNNRGGVVPRRPDMDRLREGVGAWDAAAWIEHLESLIPDLAADPATLRNMTLDRDAVFRGASAGLPLSGFSTLRLLDEFEQMVQRAERAEEVADAFGAFLAGFIPLADAQGVLAAFSAADQGVERLRTAWPDPEAGPPVEVESLDGVDASVTVEAGS